jgi:hypothetical protein
MWAARLDGSPVAGRRSPVAGQLPQSRHRRAVLNLVSSIQPVATPLPCSDLLEHERATHHEDIIQSCIKGPRVIFTDGNFLLLRPYHGEHGPKVSVTPEYIVLQRVLQKRECMSILTNGAYILFQIIG